MSYRSQYSCLLVLLALLLGSTGLYIISSNITFTNHQPWELAKKETLPISVVLPSDLNLIERAREPIQESNRRTFGFMFKSKPLAIDIEIDKTGYVSGESILVNASIDNKSNTKIMYCDILLFQESVYSGQFIRPGKPSHAKERSHKDIICHVRQPGVEKRTTARWDNIAVHVPCVPATGLDGCSIIDTSYYLKIRLVPPGTALVLETEIPIVIGNVPLQPSLLESPVEAPFGPAPDYKKIFTIDHSEADHVDFVYKPQYPVFKKVSIRSPHVSPFHLKIVA